VAFFLFSRPYRKRHSLEARDLNVARSRVPLALLAINGKYANLTKISSKDGGNFAWFVICPSQPAIAKNCWCLRDKNTQGVF